MDLRSPLDDLIKTNSVHRLDPMVQSALLNREKNRNSERIALIPFFVSEDLSVQGDPFYSIFSVQLIGTFQNKDLFVGELWRQISFI
jgi:hypothetical protein